RGEPVEGGVGDRLHGQSAPFRSNPRAGPDRQRNDVPVWRRGTRCGTLRCVNELAITVVGRDRPGIVADVSACLAGLGFNLTDSTMTILRGHFAMTLICVGGAGAAEVDAALGPLTADGALVATVREVPTDSAVHL